MVCTDDWQETPFLMQGFMIESLDDIDTVAEYSEHVWIDAVREQYGAAKTVGRALKRRSRRERGRTSGAPLLRSIAASVLLSATPVPSA